MHRRLFALAWADARVTGDAGEKAVTFRPEAKALDYIHPLQARLGALAYRPPQGGKKGMERKRKVFRKGLLSGGEYFFWCA